MVKINNRIMTLMGSLLAVLINRHWDKKVIDNRNEKINSLRTQRDILDHWLTMKEQAVSIDTYLKGINCKKVGIYGLSILGSHLYEDLKRSNHVTKLIGIDQSDICDTYNMDILKPTDPLGDIELVIITSVSDYMSIEDSLKKKFSGKIMSMQKVINECEKFYSYDVN